MLIEHVIPASELHFTPEIKKRTAPLVPKSYGLRDALVYSPEADGAIRTFHETRKGRELLAQYITGIDEIKHALVEIEPRPEQRNRLDAFAERVMQGGGPNSSFSTQSAIIYGYGKNAFDRIRTAMHDERIPVRELNVLLKELPSRLDVCAPGVTSNMLDVAQRLEMLCDGGTVAAAKQAYYEVMEQLLLEFVRTQHQYYDGNEIHFVNGYRNAVARDFGLHTVKDDFIDHSAKNKANIHRCSAFLRAKNVEHLVIDLMTERCMLAEREHFPVNGTMPYADATLEMQRRLEDALATCGLTTTFQALVRSVDDAEADEQRFTLAIDEAAVKRELARSLRVQGILDPWKSRTLAADAGAGAMKTFGNVFYVKERETQEAADGVKATYRRPFAHEVSERWNDLHMHLPQLPALGIDLTQPDAEGRNALMFAARHGNRESVEFLLGHAPELLNEPDRSGDTALAYAAQEGHGAIIRLLMQNGAEDRDGRILRKTAATGRADTVQTLLDHGSPVTARDRRGKTAFDHAVIRQNTEVLDVLFRNGVVPNMPNRFPGNWFRYFLPNDDRETMEAYLHAQYRFATMHAEGHGVPQDDSTAFTWLKNAANQGHAEAEWRLGTMYEHGRGIARSDVRALEWYEKAAEHGDARAQYELGVRYERGHGVLKNDRIALVWFGKAAAQSHAHAQYHYGIMYAEGRGVDADAGHAFMLIDQAASQGHREACYRLGGMYAEGYGVPRDDAKALELLTEGAEAGNAAAQCRLGIMYADGRGVAPNHRTALGWFLKSAKRGNAEAQYRLGIMYANGRGVARNDKTAFGWFEKAAANENTEAQYQLSSLYDKGRGINKNNALAIYWLTQSAEHGNIRAQNELGNRYYFGLGVARDDASAFVWYTRAAEQGDAKARNILGLMYSRGRGVVQDDAAAVLWYTRAAEQGNADAQSDLGTMYECGLGVAQDYASAASWYMRAAKQGNANAQFKLGTMYERGLGVAQDHAAAFAWYTRVAEHGNTSAQNNLGAMYEHGLGMTQDYAAAVSWYMRAAKQGNANAQFNLSAMYESGRGVAKSGAASVRWLTKAAKQGSAKAQNHLGKIYQEGCGVLQNDTAAVSWYARAAAQGDACAQLNLGRMYEYGRGITRDDVAAIDWYAKASAQGNAEARFRLRARDALEVLPRRIRLP